MRASCPGFDVAVRLPEDPQPWFEWLRARGIATPENFWDIYAPVGGSGGRPTAKPPRYGADDTEAAFLTEKFLSWLGDQGGAPWFAHVSYLRPHPPFIVPEPFNTMFAPDGGPAFRRAATAEGEAAVHPLVEYWLTTTGRDSHFVIGAEPGPVAAWSDQDFRTVRAVYYGMIAEVDRQIGRLLDGLAAAGRERDTIVVFTSDHGEMLGDHWTLGKFGYFDQACHVPLIVVDPRRSGGGRVDAFSEAVDIMPTLLDLAGSAQPGHLDGRSLAPFLDGATPPAWRDAVHWEYDFRDIATGAAQAFFGLDIDSCSLAVHRDEKFKYVHFAGLKPLLFDLEDDPDELVDRADDPAYAAVRLASAEALLAWRARHLERTLTGIQLTPLGPVDGRTGEGATFAPAPDGSTGRSAGR